MDSNGPTWIETLVVTDMDEFTLGFFQNAHVTPYGQCFRLHQ